MRISDHLASQRFSLSFEFFPPKTDTAAVALERTVADLRPLCPTFVSVTYGAGGSTRGRTLELAGQIKREAGIEAMAHLTCAGHSRQEIDAILLSLRDAGIENIMALRGDPPAGTEQYEARPDGFNYGSELIGFIRDADLEFCIGGAAYPEGHIESADRHCDLRFLVEKQERGASFFITQLFFDNAFYFDFVQRARRAGVTCPIIAGIMPIENADQIRRFTLRCGATIPARLTAALDRCAGAEEVQELGIAWTTEQCLELIDRGAPGIHFYTLNRSHATRRLVQAIRLFLPQPPEQGSVFNPFSRQGEGTKWPPLPPEPTQ